jgi:DNA-binding Lrp family transcriptional regulator
MNSASGPGAPAPLILGDLERTFINRYQGDFPLVERPFAAIAQALGTDEERLILLIQGLLKRGLLTRFGPLFDAERMGGRFTLAAMAVPETDFDRVAAQLAALPEVAHNYRRDHALNMWFVLATPSEASLRRMLGQLRDLTGLEVLDFPKLAEYHLGFWLQMEEDGGLGMRRWMRSPTASPAPLDALDLTIVTATQGGLPLVAAPYAEIARRLGQTAATVQARLAGMLARGAIRRIGAVPNHYRLGLRGNGMTVWDIEDAAVDRLGAEIGALAGVSHCYRRPRRLPLWPYNLFAMLHGRDRAEVLAAAARVQALVAGQCRGHEVLFSAALLKKTGLRFTPQETF